jgi:hypothetical protein
LFEICCGIYFPCFGFLKSKYLPEQCRSGVMNFFRVPLNIMVVAILLKVNSSSSFSFPIYLSLSLVGSWMEFLVRVYNSYMYASTWCGVATICSAKTGTSDSRRRYRKQVLNMWERIIIIIIIFIFIFIFIFMKKMKIFIRCKALGFLSKNAPRTC